MTEKTTGNISPDSEPIGPARDFAIFSKQEYERRVSTVADFNPGEFHEAVELVLSMLRGQPAPGRTAQPRKAAGDQA